MAVYKVPQDVEAEDKLVGPFSLRQFIFLIVMVALLYFTYLLVININPLMGVFTIPFIIFFAALAFPWRQDQSTETYLAAIVHFWLKSRKRIWDQEGHLEHVRIIKQQTVEKQYSDGRSDEQVRAQLHNLAQTLDTRGWAAKNVDANNIAEAQAPLAGATTPMVAPSDRLIMPEVSPSNNAIGINQDDIRPHEDILDEANNPIAQNFDRLVSKQAQQYKDQIKQQMQTGSVETTAPTPAQQATGQFGNVPTYNPYPDMRQTVIQPDGQAPEEQPVAQQAPAAPPQQPVAAQPQPADPAGDADARNAILNLASNSDLSVSAIARQAEQAFNSGDTIELH